VGTDVKRRFLAIGMVATVSTGLALNRPAAQAPTATSLLERYAGGEFEAVATELGGLKDFDDLLKQLRHDGQAWIEAGPEADRPRRELAAATFALEAARADEWTEWKLVQSHPEVPSHPADSLFWKPPPLLIEWACALFGREPAPRPIERWWQLAALAVAERAEDFEFLIGSPFEARGNKESDEIQHLVHAAARFPHERRFALAQGIALDWRTWPEHRRGTPPHARGTREAEQVFESLTKDETVGGEASVRLGVLRLREGDAERALDLFDRAEDLTRDPYVVYLARFSAGQAYERKKRTADAMRSYRGALATIPRAQSASMALSSLLFLGGARAEAAAISEAALTAFPLPLDPWRAYADADDRFWPELIAHLRAEIRR
jgi:tetratricopeptide (TPR) repeat protein